MKIAHFYPFTGKDKGGIAACLPLLLEALQERNVGCELWTQGWPGQAAHEALPFAVTRALTVDRSGFGYSRVLKDLWGQRQGEFDVLHSHGLWMYSDFLAFQSARAAKKPHVITPHGMLEPWALSNSARKKKLMRRVFQDRALANARVLHALCEAEREVMRALGLRAPIAVVPNGVSLSQFADLPAPAVFDRSFPAARDRRVLLFMARLHPKKGVLPLLQAWRQLAPQFPDWLLVVAGPDEAGHRATLETAVQQFGLGQAVSFTGMLDGALKRAALARADAFVLPSLSEGFSIALLEAMACGLPVVLTPECHFPDAVSAGAALQAAPEPQSLEEQLRALLESSETQRRAMGARGRALVAQNYSWEKVAADLQNLYRWCLDAGPAPACVDEGA